jgi:pyroglutamyl-peptidase
MRILLTGFEPFGTHLRNPSWDAVGEFSSSSDSDQVVKALLPVDYKNLEPLLEGLLEDQEPDLLLMLGVMSETGFFRLETRAHNVIGESADNTGYTPSHRLIDENGPGQIDSRFPWEGIRDELNKEGLPAELSRSAGTYLCNYSYYHALSWAQGRSTWVGFLHVPVIGAPFSLEEIQRAIDISIRHGRARTA